MNPLDILTGSPFYTWPSSFYRSGPSGPPGVYTWTNSRPPESTLEISLLKEQSLWLSSFPLSVFDLQRASVVFAVETIRIDSQDYFIIDH